MPFHISTLMCTFFPTFFFFFFLPLFFVRFIFGFPISQLRRCFSLIFAPRTYVKDSHMYVYLHLLLFTKCNFHSQSCDASFFETPEVPVIYKYTHLWSMLFRKKHSKISTTIYRSFQNTSFFLLMVHKFVCFQSKKLIM